MMTTPRRNLRTLGVLAIASLIAAAATATAQQRSNAQTGRPAAVRAWEDEVVIPTYLMGPDDLNPHYFETSGSIIYPYTMQDAFTPERVDRTYRAVFLENEYLRVMCLPEIGGRIQSVFDKTTGEEMFYRNHVIRPGHIALRGAWVSGGVEWNRGPQGHTVTSYSPVDVLTVLNPDGSASLLIGNLEKNYRTGWQVTLTLQPGRKLLDERIRLYNPNDGVHGYYFWNNTAFPNRPGTRFIYPMSLGTDHDGTSFFSWPEHEGRDLTWLRNYPEPTSVFGYEVAFDFFGAYDVDRDFGLVQVADHRQLPGKKAWTWGEADSGLAAQSVLTDDDGPYIEVQSGPLPTQSDIGQLMPGQEVSWQEYWYPVAGLGEGFEYATKDVAVQRRAVDGGVELRFAGTRQVGEVDLLVFRQDGRQERRKVELSPAAVETIVIDTENTPDPGALRMRLRLQTEEGEVLLDYSSPLEIPDREPPAPPIEEPDTAATRFRDADIRDRFDDRPAARAGYRAALELDPGHARSHRALGVLDLEAGLYERAAEHLRRALARDPDDGLAWYWSGVAALQLNDRDAARAAAARATKLPGTGALGHGLAGRVAAHEGDHRAALDSFTAALTIGGSSWTRLFDQVVIAAYAAGENEQAQFLAEQTVRAGSLRLVPHVIDAFGRGVDVPTFAGRAREWLGEPDFAFIEAALAFAEQGLYLDAAALLEAGCWAVVDDASRRPMPAYYMAYFHHLRGDEDEATHWLREAAETQVERVFPSRPEGERALRFALERAPGDARVHLYLGNLLAGLGRHDEAAGSWTAAATLDPSLSVANRNLGIHAWKLTGDLEAATDWLQKAIAARPGDQTLYRDLARVLVDRDRQAEAVSVLESAPRAPRPRADVLVDLARGYHRLGRHGDAIALLEVTTFTNREGDSGTHRVFYDAHMDRGVGSYEAGDAAGALADFEAALTYPENLNAGRPYRPREARAEYWRGVALDALGRTEDASQAWAACAAAEALDEEQVEFARRCAERLSPDGN